MASSNSSQNAAQEFFPLVPDLSPEPTNGELKQQLNQSKLEVAALKMQVRAIRSQMQVSIEESVMVSEAHLEHHLEQHVDQRMEQRLEQRLEEVKVKLEKDLDMKLRMELAFVSSIVMLVCVCGAMLSGGLGF